MQRKKMSKWFSLKYLLDRCEAEGLMFTEWDGTPSTPRRAIERFAYFVMASGVEFRDDEDCRLELRMEKTEQEAMSCQTAGHR